MSSSDSKNPARPPAPPAPTRREPRYFIEGAEVYVDGTVVTIRFDVSKTIGPSRKLEETGVGSVLVASSRGNQKAFFLGIGNVFISLNAYFFPKTQKGSGDEY